MDTKTDNNAGQDTNNDNPLANDTGADASTSHLESDPVLSKHLDIAIEAQDGPKKAAATEDKSKEGEAAGKAEGSKVVEEGSTSGKKDAVAQSKPDKEGKKDEANTRGPKDLVLKGQGPDGADVVIKGGAERRFYEQAQNAKQRAASLESQVKDANERATRVETELNTLRSTVQNVQGLPPEHLATAVRMFRDLQSDPAGTLKKLLAEAVALGHSVEGISSGVDAAAITRLIDERLGKSQEQHEPTDAEITADAQKVVETFYSRFSDARPHDALIASVIRDNPGLSLEDAYFQLKDAFADKGFDWSRTLEDNLREQAGSASSQDTLADNKDKKPLPAGGNNVPAEEKHNDIVMSENADTGDIVKAAMREAGLNI